MSNSAAVDLAHDAPWAYRDFTGGFRTGLSNAKLGIWLFLASEVMLFSTFFTTLIVLRVTSAAWPRGWEVLNVPLGMFNTMVLIASSVTMVMAYAKAFDRNKKAFNIYLAITVALGILFLIDKGFEYAGEFREGHFPSTSVFYGIYFTMTALHGIHVICGILVNAALLLFSRKQWDEWFFLGRIEGAGLYWHFVDIVWIFLFPALYLL